MTKKAILKSQKMSFFHFILEELKPLRHWKLKQTRKSVIFLNKSRFHSMR
jgi:hypothetical protein